MKHEFINVILKIGNLMLDILVTEVANSTY